MRKHQFLSGVFLLALLCILAGCARMQAHYEGTQHRYAIADHIAEAMAYTN